MAKDYNDKKICPLMGRGITYKRCTEIQSARDDTMNFPGLEIDFEEDAAVCEECRWFEIENMK